MRTLAFAALLAYSVTVAVTGSHACAAEPKRDIEQSATLGKDRITVRLFLTSSSAERKQGRMQFWGPTSAGLAIGGAQVLWNGSPISVPASAFIDLLAPREIDIVSGAGDGEAVIVVHGGDAAAAYEARIHVQRGVVKRRRVMAAEFPDEAWEETVYQPNLSTR